jgi:diamine N-acetyltransferase
MLTDLAARTFYDTFAPDNTPGDMQAYMESAFTPERQAAEIADPRSTFLIAFIGDAPAGYARLLAGDAPEFVPGDRRLELARLYADHAWHGRGVGPALIEACLDEARHGGFTTMWLGVWERNWRAIAFYRKRGFVECGNQVFKLGSDAQTDIVMARPVDVAAEAK